MTGYVVDDYLDVLSALGIDRSSCRPESIYDFGPVFVARREGRAVVIKRTRSPMRRARTLHRWTRSLRSTGVPVVTPDTAVDPNPVQVGDQVWVVYPFIEGDPYSGADPQIRSAGELLGAIHAAEVSEVNHDFASFPWPEDDPQSSDADLESLADLLAHHEIPRADDVLERYRLRLSLLHAELVPRLRSADLVWRCGPWDFKANNLVYPGGSPPVLVDPDSTGYLPRILDLALAAVLFHNEAPHAPARLFDDREWRLFLSGYKTRIALTPGEKELWPSALEFMHLEEGLWLILDDAEGWGAPRQRRFLSDLLMSDLESPPAHLKAAIVDE